MEASIHLEQSIANSPNPNMDVGHRVSSKVLLQASERATLALDKTAAAFASAASPDPSASSLSLGVPTLYENSLLSKHAKSFAALDPVLQRSAFAVARSKRGIEELRRLTEEQKETLESSLDSCLELLKQTTTTRRQMTTSPEIFEKGSSGAQDKQGAPPTYTAEPRGKWVFIPDSESDSDSESSGSSDGHSDDDAPVIIQSGPGQFQIRFDQPNHQCSNKHAIKEQLRNHKQQLKEHRRALKEQHRDLRNNWNHTHRGDERARQQMMKEQQQHARDHERYLKDQQRHFKQQMKEYHRRMKEIAREQRRSGGGSIPPIPPMPPIPTIPNMPFLRFGGSSIPPPPPQGYPAPPHSHHHQPLPQNNSGFQIRFY
ncbi:hypothetical protein BDR26DRAFT_929773 [Obelidium mucronatum]|nr:hypothetical protein BDR26DRAFT_929773 [Obelidium mucronatum]